MIKIVKYANEKNSPEVYMSKMDPNKYYIVFDKERGHIYHPHKEQDYIALKRLCLKWEVSDWEDYSMSEEDLLNSPRFVLYCMDSIGDYVKIIEFLLKGPITIATNGTYVVELNQGELRTCRTYSSEIEPSTEEDCRKKCVDNMQEPSEIEKEFCRFLIIKEHSITYEEVFNMLCYLINSNTKISNELLGKGEDVLEAVIKLPNVLLTKDDVLEVVIKLVTKDENAWENVRALFCRGWGKSEFPNKTYSSEIEPPTEEDHRKKCADNAPIPNRHEIEFCNAFGIEPRVITNEDLYELLCYYNSRVELIRRMLPLPSPDKNKENILGCLINLGNEDEEVVVDVGNYFESK